MIRKTRQHISQNESLIFEISSPGKKGYQLPDLDVPAIDPEASSALRIPARRSRTSPRSARLKPSGITRACPPGTTRSISACTRSAHAR